MFIELIHHAEITDVTTFRELARETANYMFDTVWRSLVISPLKRPPETPGSAVPLDAL